MPVLHVRASNPGDAAAVKSLMESLPAEVEAAAEIREGGVWCTYAALAAQSVGGTVTGPGHHGAAYVDIHMRPRDEEQVARVLRAAAECVARVLSIPVEDVWAKVSVEASGHVFAGGEVLRW